MSLSLVAKCQVIFFMVFLVLNECGEPCNVKKEKSFQKYNRYSLMFTCFAQNSCVVSTKMKSLTMY